MKQQLGRVRVMVGALLRPAQTQTQTQTRGHVSLHEHEQLRFMAIKLPTRAAVHGTRLPVADTLNVERRIGSEINKRKEEKENKRKEVERTVDSQLKFSDHDSSNKSPVD